MTLSLNKSQIKNTEVQSVQLQLITEKSLKSTTKYLYLVTVTRYPVYEFQIQNCTCRSWLCCQAKTDDNNSM